MSEKNCQLDFKNKRNDPKITSVHFKIKIETDNLE